MFRQFVLRSALLARTALVGFNLAQGSVTLAAPNPSEPQWEADIKAFEVADKTNPPPKSAILFVGSSSIKLWKTLAQDFPEHRVINRGFGGSQLADSVAFADRIVVTHRPKMVLLYAGDNDIAAGKAPEQVFADFKAFVQTIHAKLPDVRIAYISIKPSIARWQLVDKIKAANRMIEDHTRRNNKLSFIDVFTPMLTAAGEPRKELFVSDGLHLNAAGYELWASIVRPYLDRNRL